VGLTFGVGTKQNIFGINVSPLQQETQTARFGVCGNIQIYFLLRSSNFVWTLNIL